jgi:hypothetical protein
MLMMLFVVTNEPMPERKRFWTSIKLSLPLSTDASMLCSMSAAQEFCGTGGIFSRTCFNDSDEEFATLSPIIRLVFPWTAFISDFQLPHQRMKKEKKHFPAPSCHATEIRTLFFVLWFTKVMDKKSTRWGWSSMTTTRIDFSFLNASTRNDNICSGKLHHEPLL